MRLSSCYKLVDRVPVPATLEEVGFIFKNQHVGDSSLRWPWPCRVSTIFLAIDHRRSDGPPILFETMIFGGPFDQYQERCSTWEEAEAMHARAIAKVRSFHGHLAIGPFVVRAAVERTKKWRKRWTIRSTKNSKNDGNSPSSRNDSEKR